MRNHQAFWPSKIGLREAFLAGSEAVRYSAQAEGTISLTWLVWLDSMSKDMVAIGCS